MQDYPRTGATQRLNQPPNALVIRYQSPSCDLVVTYTATPHHRNRTGLALLIGCALALAVIGSAFQLGMVFGFVALLVVILLGIILNRREVE